MGRGMESLESAYSVLFTLMLIALAVLVMLCLVRAIIGPRVADRIVSVNMTGTMVIVMIAILALMLEEGYLVDICLIYAMISFLAVIVLVKVYMGVYLMGKQAEDTGRAEKDREEPREALQKGAEEWSTVPQDEESGDAKQNGKALDSGEKEEKGVIKPDIAAEEGVE